MNRLQAIAAALREGAGRIRMAVIAEPDEFTGAETFSYCPAAAVDTLYGPTHRAGVSRTVAEIDLLGRIHPKE